MNKANVIALMDVIYESMLVGAMAIESAGRIRRIVGGRHADKGMVMATQFLYSVAYGLKDFRSKLDGSKYRR